MHPKAHPPAHNSTILDYRRHTSVVSNEVLLGHPPGNARVVLVRIQHNGGKREHVDGIRVPANIVTHRRYLLDHLWARRQYIDVPQTNERVLRVVKKGGVSLIHAPRVVCSSNVGGGLA